MSNQLDIYVQIEGQRPFQDGNYTFTLLADDPSLMIPPIVITVPILYGDIPPEIFTNRILYSNDYSNVNWLAGDPRPDATLLGDPNNGELYARNIRVDPIIYANQANGFKVSAGNIVEVLKQKLISDFQAKFDCNTGADPNCTLPTAGSSVSVNFLVDTKNLPGNSSVSILDPTVTVEGVAESESSPCTESIFNRYITVIFVPPSGLNTNTNWQPFLGDRSGTTTSQQGVDPNSDAPSDGSGGTTFPGNGGTGTVPQITTTIGPILVVEPDPIDFDDTDVGTVRNRTFRLTNIGDTAATVTGMSSTLLSEPFFFGFGTNYPFQLLPTQAVTGTVVFSPPSAALFEDFAQVTMDLGGADVVAAEVLVTGTGVTSGDPGETKFKGIAVSGDTQLSKELNFGNQGINDGPTSRLVTVYNTGNDPAGLTISAATVIGADAVQFSTGIPGGSYTIPYGGIFQVEVIYDPNAAANHTTTFRITSDADEGTDDPINGYNYIDVLGTGTIFTPTRILEINGDGDFGELIAGETKDQAITLTNKGNSPILIRGFLSPGPFTLDLEGFGLGAINPTVFEQSVINGVVYPTVYSYVFPIAYPLLPEITSPGITIIFSPPSVDIYSGLIAIDLTQPLTFGPTTFPVSGVGIFRPLPPPEPEPDPEPDPEPGPDPGVDPPPNPLSPTCIQKSCEVPYIYDYSVNDLNLT
jgi:hypothetical protein